MKIDDAYFRRLLNSTNVSAIFELEQLWTARPGVSETAPQFGLSEPEYNVHLALLYAGEVRNDGHTQYFLNPAGRHASETVGALRAIGLTELAEILQRARDDLGKADASFDRESVFLFDSLHEYLVANERHILKPERSD